MHEIDQDLINTRGSCEPPGCVPNAREGNPAPGEKPLMRYDWERQMLVPIPPEREPVSSLAWALIVVGWLLLAMLGMG